MSVSDGAPIAALARQRVNDIAEVDDALLARIVDAIRIDQRVLDVARSWVFAGFLGGSLLRGFPVLNGLLLASSVATLGFLFAPPARRRFQLVCETLGLAPHVTETLWRRRGWGLRFNPAATSIDVLAGRPTATQGRRARTMLKLFGGGLAVTFGTLGLGAFAVRMGFHIPPAAAVGVPLVGLLTAILGPLLALAAMPSEVGAAGPAWRIAIPPAPSTPPTEAGVALLASAVEEPLSRVPDGSAETAEAEADAVVVARR